MRQQRIVSTPPPTRPGAKRRQRKFPKEPLLGTRIKALAVLRGFSLRELADATEMKYDRLRNIVYGIVQDIHSAEMQRIADMAFKAGLLERRLDVRDVLDRSFIPADIRPAEIDASGTILP